MDIAVSAWSAVKVLQNKQCTLKGFIDFCKNNGVQDVEFLDCFWEDGDHYKRIKKYMDQKGVRCCSYSISSDLVCGEPAYSECIEYIKQSVDIAAALSTKCVRIFPGTPKDGIDVESGYALIRQGLKECCEYAGSKGIYLSMENHGVYGGISSSLKRIMNEVGSDYLKTNPDTGNFLLGGENPVEAFRSLRGNIKNVHFKDFVICEKGVYTGYDGKQQFTGCVLGKGIVPLKEIVDELKATGYEGCISIEYEGIENDCMKAIQDSIAYTKSIV